MSEHTRLAHLPVSFFSTVMGLSGLAIAWKRASHGVGAPDLIWQGISLIAAAVFILYALKLWRHPGAVREELHHPVRMNFFPTISISLFLLSIAAGETLPGCSRSLWYAGVVLHLGFTLMAISSWIHHSHYEVKHMNPAWFIPVVGNLFVPIVGVNIAPPEVSWFFFSIGIVFWLVLLTIVMNRLFFHDALPDRLTPTLFILLAPPAVGFIAWTALQGGLDSFGRILYNFGLFLTLLFASNVWRFVRLPFYISSWAYSFPIAAIVIATFTISALTGLTLYTGVALLLLGILSLLIAFLTVRTLLAVRAGTICQPE
jgi:tellurite resistance protein